MPLNLFSVSCPGDSGDFHINLNNESFRYYDYRNMCVLANCLSLHNNMSYSNVDEAFNNVMHKISLQKMIQQFVEFRSLFGLYVRIRFPFVSDIFYSLHDKNLNDAQPILTVLRNGCIFLIYSEKYVDMLFEKISSYFFLYNNLNANFIPPENQRGGGGGENDNGSDKKIFRKLYDCLDEAAFTANSRSPFPKKSYGDNATSSIDPFANIFAGVHATKHPLYKNLLSNQHEQLSDSIKDSNLTCQRNIETIFHKENSEKFMYMSVFVHILENSFQTIIQTITDLPIKRHTLCVSFTNKRRRELVLRKTLSFNHPSTVLKK